MSIRVSPLKKVGRRVVEMTTFGSFFYPVSRTWKGWEG